MRFEQLMKHREEQKSQKIQKKTISMFFGRIRIISASKLHIFLYQVFFHEQGNQTF